MKSSCDSFFKAAFLACLIFSLLAVGCGKEGPPSMVLIMVDTLRADHLGCYGYDQDTAPRIDRLAREGTVFDQVLAASPWTGPSVVSMITGKYPDEVGIRDLRDPLPPMANTLAERLKSAGYATAAVSSNAFVGPAYGHKQGYDDFYFARHDVYPADKVTDQALEWLETRKGQKHPFFLYIHYTDPHRPYDPPEQYRDQFLQGLAPLDRAAFPDENYVEIPPGLEDFKRIKAYYDGEIAFTDFQVGRLLDALPVGTVVGLVGDHGEEFFEHGGFLHGHTLYQELLHVPLILRGEGFPAHKRVGHPVSHVDLLPTFLDVAGVGAGKGLMGQSLRPLAGEESEPKPRYLFSVLETRENRVFVVRWGIWKLHYIPADNRAFLYDLTQDPGEMMNRANENPQIVNQLLEAIKARESRIIPPPPLDDPEMRKEREEELRALGYI